MSNTPDTASQAQPKRFGQSLLDLATLIGPVGALTGLLYYFGYASAKAYYTYFGISLSVLDLSTTDYLVRTDTFFQHIVTVLLLVSAGFIGHQVLQRLLDRPRPRRARIAVLILATAGLFLGATAVLGLYDQPRGLLSPMSLALAALALDYAVSTMDKHGTPPPAMVDVFRAGVALRRGLVTALVVVSTFWTTTNIAQARGSATARLVERSLPLQPQAVVYSVRNLHLPGPGIGLTHLAGKANDYRYRYNGLRPLHHANDRWFLLPVGWRHDNGATIIVLDDEPGQIRVDLAPS